MSEENQSLEFGNYRLDAQERLLSRNGKPVPLTPKAFDILLVLLRHSGRLVGKDQLMQEVWPDSFVEEINLTVNISALRKTLGEGQKGQKFIETVPKRGYRFVAPVRQSEQATERPGAKPTVSSILPEKELPEQDDSRPEPRAKLVLVSRLGAWKRPWVAICLFAFIVIGLTMAHLLFRSAAKPSPKLKTPRTLAVLAFRNIKNDADSDFLSYSLAEAIIGKLGSVNQIVVRPSSYADKYKNKEIDPRQVARELNVQTLLTGSFLKEGDDLRISVELVDAENKQTLWRDVMDLRYEKLMTVQDRVARSVVSALQLKLLPEEAERLRRDLPQNSLAYEYYLRGLDAGKRNTNREEMIAARMFEKSVELEPTYTRGWVALADAYASFIFVKDGGREYVNKCQAALKRALALDPDNLEARLYVAFLMIDAEGRGEEAIPILRDILKTNSNNADAHGDLSEAYRYGGMLDESIQEGEQALRLDPGIAGTVGTLNTYFYAGQYERFIQSLPKAEGPRVVFYRGLGYYYLKRYDRAIADFDRAFELDHTFLHARIGQAFKHRLTGQKSEGVKLLRRIEEEFSISDGELLYKIAQGYAVLDEKPSALRMLRQSIERNFFCYPYFIHDSMLQNIRGEPEYARLMELARQRHEAFKSKFFSR